MSEPHSIHKKRQPPQPRVERICRRCGKTFKVMVATIRQGAGFYCSRACYFPARIERSCQCCGKAFLVQPAVVAAGGGVYCSLACSRQVPADSVATRFWARVVKDGPVPSHCPELGPCWRWTGATHQYGYGRLHVLGRVVEAHRVSWELHFGPLPASAEVLHRCDNPVCSNPAHLFLGSNADNRQDSVAKGRQACGEGLPQAKLTDAKVRRARKLHARGWTVKDLAILLRVHPLTVHDLLRGITWKHLPL